ncbi:Inter-alpha-trypsin inhibitor heavy chain H5 [Geodia barretti]|uniref:Inter-alpha-trypsin inhibitor heavy chain H5 n=1 Tax=Geodia barretti TaxID=519541 RepID=A0AA35SKJ3_GEOBA|nr:Inter-alpha-trypsin inhibitor heavy chain H5 [Geodia barretti]
MMFVITYLFLPMNRFSQEQADALAVDLINDADAPRKRKLKPKPPLTKKMYDPNQDLARDAMEKKIETARNKMDEVIKLSSRVVLKDVEVNKAPLSEVVPDLMTDAQLRDAEASNLRRLIAQPGQTDGRGIVTGRVRARGDGMGRFRGGGQDGSDGGLLGGDGSAGIADRLGIIDFLDEFGGPKEVVYCLDITASMQAAGMKKLPIAIDSLKDSVMMLGNNDKLNIVAFSDTAKPMSEKMLPANPVNIKRVLKYLDRFTPQSIQGNLDTNILSAIKSALTFEPTVVVLITDGLPQVDEGALHIETNTQKILDIVREHNRNNAIIYVVALEIDLKRSPGAKLLISLAEEHGGKIKAIDGGQLFEFTEQDELTD